MFVLEVFLILISSLVAGYVFFYLIVIGLFRS